MSHPEGDVVNDGNEVIFLTREELSTPSTIQLPEPEKPVGLILEDGSINWNCPCLGGMVSGPCGVQFRNAFSCFHYSKAEPQGSDCLEAFNKMTECMQKYPKLYGSDDKEGGDDLFDVEQKENEMKIDSDRKPKIQNTSKLPDDNREDQKLEKKNV